LCPKKAPLGHGYEAISVLGWPLQASLILGNPRFTNFGLKFPGLILLILGMSGLGVLKPQIPINKA
jgi:hypothetical protein